MNNVISYHLMWNLIRIENDNFYDTIINKNKNKCEFNLTTDRLIEALAKQQKVPYFCRYYVFSKLE